MAENTNELINGVINTLSTLNLTTYVGVVFLILFSWEHFFRLYKFPYRPTVGINKITKQLQTVFEFFGSCIARISSFLMLIDLREIGETFCDLFGSSFNLLTSGIYVLKGYFERSRHYIGNKNLIYLGSFLLALSMMYIYKYVNFSTLILLNQD